MHSNLNKKKGLIKRQFYAAEASLGRYTPRQQVAVVSSAPESVTAFTAAELWRNIRYVDVVDLESSHFGRRATHFQSHCESHSALLGS